MFTIINISSDSEEIFELKTIREIATKLKEIENSYVIYEINTFYAEDIVDKIVIKTIPLWPNNCIDGVLQLFSGR